MMQDLDKTTRFTGAACPSSGSLVTIFDGSHAPKTLQLSSFGRNYIYFGRDPQNDIVLT